MSLRGMGCEVGENASHSLRACVGTVWGMRRRCVGERKCSGRACRCVGAGVDLRRGRHRAACGRASGLRGRAEVLGKGVSLCVGGRRSSAGNGW